MAFQKCPACNGAGSTGIGFPYGETCSVCQGQKIINESTGLPPRRIVTTTGTTIGNFEMETLNAGSTSSEDSEK